MKKRFIILFLIIKCIAFSQEQDAIVYFRDKPNAAAALSNPLSMLTQRSLDRRINQNIALSFSDVPIYQTYFDQINNASGVVIKAKSKWLNCVYVRGLIADIQLLSSLSFVESINFLDNTLNFTNNLPIAVESRIKKVSKTAQPNTTFNYGNSFNQIHMLNGDVLHQQNFTGLGKIIAVLDSGFPGVNTVLPFQRLIINNQILGGYDFVNKSLNFYSGDLHGTWVLSCMGGFVDNQLVGTAPDAQYYLYITEDVSSESPVEEANWVEAAEEADRVGVDIITTSLGYFAFDDPNYSHSYSDMTGNKNYASKGANIAFSKGIIVVASAGNEGASNTEPHVGVPAEATNVLAIGAVKSDRNRANFSSIGPSFDNRIKPDIMAQGQLSVVANYLGNIQTANGTSFSGPIMAGMIASFWQAVPTLTNQEVVNLVKQSSDRFATPDNFYGYGIPNFLTALNLSNTDFQNTIRKNFVLYPNPVNNQLNIFFPNDFSNASINLFNTIGQNIAHYETTTTNATIDTSNLSSGIYMYKIESNNQIQVGKIIKN